MCYYKNRGGYHAYEQGKFIIQTKEVIIRNAGACTPPPPPPGLKPL